MALSVCNSTTDLRQKELVRHGTAAFPIACYADDLSADLVPWHWHEEWELALVTRGSAVLLLENAQVTLTAGDGLFINSRALHAVDSPRSQGAALRSAVFHPRLVGGSGESVYWQRLVLPLAQDKAPRYAVFHRENPCHREILDLFQQAWEATAFEPEDFENRTRYLLSRVMGLLIRHCVPETVPVSQQDRIDAERIRAMLAYIDAHFTQELTTRHIAAAVNVSESVCLRCFHRMLGTTPIQYTKQLRLEKAASLLRTTPISAKDAALTCGFRDVSYFTRAFRELLGCTPKQYQQKMQPPAPGDQ